MPDRSTLENKAVEAYLHFLATGELPMDPDREIKMEALEGRIATETRLHVKVVLIAQREAMVGPSTTAQELQARFLDYGTTFGERNQVTYAAWRAMGVPPRVLKAMGLKGRSPAPAEGDGRAKQPRHKRNAEFAAAVFQLYMERGREAVAERYGYKSAHSVTSVLHELSRRFPEVAKAHGYNHKAEAMSTAESLTRAHAASAAARKAS